MENQNVPVRPDEILKAAEELARPVIDGEVNALREYAKLRAQINVLNTAVDLIKDEVMTELMTYEGSQHNVFGVKLEIGSTPKKWDFSEVESWNEATREFNEAKKKRAEIEKALKASYGSGLNLADTDTGEEIKVKLISPGGSTLKATFPKR